MSTETLDEAFVNTEAAPSPFLPGTRIQFAWDSTSLGLFKTCPRLYQYTMLEGWVGKRESIDLRFGSEYHSALEYYDHMISQGKSRDVAIRETVRHAMTATFDWEVDETEKPGKYKNRRSLIALIIDYLDKFDPDPAETYIKSDGTPAVELSFRFDLEYGPQSTWVTDSFNDSHCSQPYILCGHLDRVVNFNSQLFVIDRKTTTRTLSAGYFAQYNPNNQMSLYTFAASLILHQPIRGVIIDAAQIKLEEPNAFARGFTFRTEAQTLEWLDDLQTTLSLAETYALNNYWPMNDTSCDKFGGCKFRGICSKDPHVREAFLRTDFIKQPETERWNPLRSR